MAWRKTIRRYGEEMLAAILADLVIYLALLIYLAFGTVYVLSRKSMLLGALDIYARTCFLTYCLILPFIVLVIGISVITHRLDRRRRLAYRHMFGPRRVARFLAGTLLMMLVLLPFEAMFASVKTTISDFPIEKAVADIDRFVHFGRDPVEYLLSFARNPWVLHVVEFNYDVVWFIICFGTLYWVAVSPRAERIRLRYCAAFFLVWVVVGNFAAVLVPTAGPAFYGLVTGDATRFRDGWQFVSSTAGSFASAADAQRYLWSLHTAGVSGFGSGISAFPSVHVALIGINAMFITEHNRRLGVLAWAYVVFIMLSSVYLGWHYAVDGYAALLLAGAIYWAARRLAPVLARLGQWQPALGARYPVPAEARSTTR